MAKEMRKESLILFLGSIERLLMKGLDQSHLEVNLEVRSNLAQLMKKM